MTREQGDSDRARARPSIWPLSARRGERNRADDPTADDASSAADDGYPLSFDQPTHEISAFAHPTPSGPERPVPPATHAGAEHAAQRAGPGDAHAIAGSADPAPGAGGAGGGGASRRPSRPRAESGQRGADDVELEYPGLGHPQSGRAAGGGGERPGPAPVDPRSPSANPAGPGRRVERAGRSDAADPSAPARAGAFSAPDWSAAPPRRASYEVPEGEDLGAQDPSAPARKAAYGQLGAIVQAAEHAAEDLRERTEERAKARIAEAERSATYRIQAAEDEAGELLASARAEAERLVKEAREVAERIVGEAGSAAEQLHEQASAAAQQVQEQALAAAAEIEQRAHEAANEIVERGRVSARERVVQAGDVAVDLLADGQELSQHLNELALSLRANAERLLADIRGVHGVMTTRLSRVDPELMAEVNRTSEPPRRRSGAQGDAGESSRAKSSGRGEAGRGEAGRGEAGRGEAGRGEAARAGGSLPQEAAAPPWDDREPPTGNVGVPEFHPPRRPWRR